MIRPLQKGQVVGRSTGVPSRRSNIICSSHVPARRRRQLDDGHRQWIENLCCRREGAGEPIARHRPSRCAAAARVVPRHRREKRWGRSRRAAARTRVAVTGTRACDLARGRGIHRITSWMLSDVDCTGRPQKCMKTNGGAVAAAARTNQPDDVVTGARNPTAAAAIIESAAIVVFT